jgi:TonB-linked SusC/RagA family outer membrane protein
MRVLACAVALLVTTAGMAFGQQGTVEGTVTDAKTGETVPGVNVVLEEVQQGAATGANGEFRIADVEPGSYTLQASFVGYSPYEQTINVSAGEVTEVSVELSPQAVQLDEVAVTALGAERQRDELGSAQSTIQAEAINESPEVSITKSLSAKASGLQVTGYGGDPGSGARITIRGNSTIQGDNQPLIVIDGQPISNQTFEQGVAGVQQQSRLNDLNPQDIASVEVLKGASAAALWGSRAQSGVILIETKKGRYDSKTDVTFSSSVRIDQQNQSQDLQEAYGQGVAGQFSRATSFSWGDRIADREGGQDEFVDTDLVAVGQQTGQEYRPVIAGSAENPHGGKNSRETYDHSTRLFETGTLFENSLSVSGGGDQSRFYLSLGHTNQSGIIPANSNYERTSIRVNAERQITDDLSIRGNANYIKTNSDRVQQGSNIDGLLLGAYRTPPDFNNADYTVNRYPDGRDGAVLEGLHRSFNGGTLGAVGQSGNPTGPGYANPRFTFNNTTNHSIVNRIVGQVETNYDPLAWLNFTARAGVDTYSDRRNAFFPVYSSGNPSGAQEEQEFSEYRVNVDVIGRATRPITDEINSSLTLGFNFNHQEFDEVDVDLNNFSNPVEVRSLGNAAASDVSGFLDQSTERTASVYGELRFDLYDQLFLTGTGRVDRASTFGPEAEASFFYPSGTLAWQFHKVLPENDVLSFGKLRASVGQVGRQPGPYQAFTYFSPGTYFDGFTATTLQASGYGGGFERNNVLGNAIISPEKTTEYEGGLDLRFLEDRVRLSATYYYKKTTEAILDVAVAPTTGYDSRTDNVAEITNEGVELDLSADWIASGSFQWTSDFRWSTNENIVQDLAGVEEVALEGFTSATSSLVEGEPYGVLFGERWRRASFAPVTDAEAQQGFTVGNNGRVLNADGFPVQANTQGVIGDPNPEWNLGITNTFRYKGVSLDFLIDYRHGGDVWNGTRGALSFFGRHGSQDFYTTVSEDVATNPDVITYDGLTIAQAAEAGLYNATQNQNGSYSFRGEIKDFGAGKRALTGPYYYSGPGSGFTGPGEQFIEDGGFFRLRRVSLGYTWDSELIQQTGLSSINVSATARNLLLITDYSGIDPETNLTGPSNGQGIDYFNNPNTRSYQFTLRLNY